MVACPQSQSDDNALLIVTPSDGITGTAYSYFYNDSGVTFRVLLSMIINVQRPKTTNKFIQINDAKKKWRLMLVVVAIIFYLYSVVVFPVDLITWQCAL